MTIQQTSAKKEDAVKIPEPSKGIVLYSDGGFRANLSGWGVHGYVFENSVPKKGAGADDNFLTKIGYVIKGMANTIQESVKPLYYIDGFGSDIISATNNVAELRGARYAMIKALELIQKHAAEEGKIESVILYTDSDYTVKGVNEWSPIWIKRNWFRADGSPVPNAAEWKLLLQAHTELLEACPDTKIQWVRGHGDSLGNNRADKYATIGVMYSISGIGKIDFSVTQADGYWKRDTVRHPFLSHRKVYFNTLASANVAGEYYMGDHGPENDHHGKRMSDNAYSFVQLKEPEQAIESIRDKFCIEAAGNDSIIILSADTLFVPETHGDMLEHGHRIIPFYKNGMAAYTLSGKPLTEEKKPPGLSYRAVETMTTLDNLLGLYKAKSDKLTMLDITDVLYEKEMKKKGKEEIEVTKLKAQYVVGIRALPLKLKMVTEKGTADLPLILTFGIDLPERNILKQLESLEPIVTLLAWQDAPDVARYAVVIESRGSYGVWSGIHSNLVIITPDKYIV